MSNLLSNAENMTELQASTNGCEDFKGRESDLDAGIAGAVVLLCKAGIETVQSCEGGAGHAYPVPTVEFWGGKGAGLEALAVCVAHDLPVMELCKVWKVDSDRMIFETLWRIVFYKKVYLTDVGGVDNPAEIEAKHIEAKRVWGGFVDKTYADAPASAKDEPA